MASNIYQAVMEELNKRGWKRGGRGNDAGPKCLAGCMTYIQFGTVSHMDMTKSLEYKVLARAIKECFPRYKSIVDGYDTVIEFNDEPARLMEDIRKVLVHAQNIDPSEVI